MHGSTGGRRSAGLVAVILLASGLAIVGVGVQPAAATVTSVKGSACGYYVNVGLFGGPQSVRGCGQLPSAPATAASPSVTLPASGSATPITATDPDGAAGVYGPATIFGGIWPLDVALAPPSGPITVSTQGTTGTGGSVTSSTDITLHPTPVPVRCYGQTTGTNCLAPGGFGPNPVWGDSLHVECTASETSVSGLTRFSNAFVAKATDSDGEPIPAATEPIPNTPPPNYTRSGVITNVGDVFTAVFNEQIFNADGSLTVNAVHMYLFGPVAVGEVVKGQATCGTTPAAATPHDNVAPNCGTRVVSPVAPDDPTPKVPREELQGVFDTGGLQSITNVQITNGTVKIGVFPNDDTDPSNDYLKFTPGQTGPLSLIATRTNEALPMTWSFDATDAAGNTSHCVGTTSAVAITSPGVATFVVGAAGTFNVTASGTPTLTVSQSGFLPTGLSYSVATRTLSGTPGANTAGNYPLAFSVSDGDGTNAVQTFWLTVRPNSVPVIQGFTWYSDGSSSKSGPAGTVVAAFGTSLRTSSAFRLASAPVQANPDLTCNVDLVPLNTSLRFTNSRGFVANTSGVINRPPGTYDICFVRDNLSALSLPLSFTIS